MPLQSLASWVRRHRQSIDAVARSMGYRGRMNDDERADWVANVEELYLWAKGDGADV